MVRMSAIGGFLPWLAWANLNNGGKCGLAAVNTNNDLTNTNWNIAAGAPTFRALSR